MAQALTALIFPGQGSQYVGMDQIVRQRPAAQAILARAGAILGNEALDRIGRGPAAELNQTLHAQPALLAISIAHLAAWREIDQTPVAILAGHSAGQYAAAVAAEAIDFEDALLLIQARARLMSQAVAGGMVAVLGLPQTQLKPLIAAAREYGEIGLANDNSPGQIVLAGIAEAVAAVPQLAAAAGARRTVVLPINVASHSPLMRRVRIELAVQLESVTIQSPRLPIMSNLRAELISDSDRLRFELAQHLVRPVRWRQAIEKMIKLGVGHFIEVGPGRVLSGLVRRIDETVSVRSLDRNP